MKHYEFWFIVGSQTLYGEDVLTTVANRAEEMAQKLSDCISRSGLAPRMKSAGSIWSGSSFAGIQ